MKIWIIWTGYVWLIQAVWLAKLWFKNSKINWIIIATEYKSFNDLDWENIFSKISMPVIFDGRNILNKDMVKKIGFIYKGI